MRHLFVTGAQRSGTTLLSRMLDAQAGIAMLAQPFPLLLIDVKRQYLESTGNGSSRYPLSHLFREPRERIDGFREFLGRWTPDETRLRATFELMAGYSGQYTRFDAAAIERATGAASGVRGFANVYRALVDALVSDTRATIRGTKETSCEEFIPSMLGQGIDVIVIVRDPRDVLASLNHGKGTEHAGAIKPTLFNLRSWRRSVASVIAMRSHPRLAWCRYEELVTAPDATLSSLAKQLGLHASLDASAVLRDGEGRVWTGNSSHRTFEGIGQSSVGMHRSVLPREVARVAEAATLPEMKWLGYETAMTFEDAAQALRHYAEPYQSVRAGLDADSFSTANVEIEIERLRQIAYRTTPDENLFLFDGVAPALREAWQR